MRRSGSPVPPVEPDRPAPAGEQDMPVPPGGRNSGEAPHAGARHARGAGGMPPAGTPPGEDGELRGLSEDRDLRALSEDRDLRALIRHAVTTLDEAGVPSPDHDARELAAYVLGVDQLI